ncbi:chaperone protein DNAj [Lotmaria passim]
MRASKLMLAGLRRLPLTSVTTGALPLAAAMALPLITHARFASSKNPYTVLGIKQGAEKAEIKKAYRVMARKYHPDAPGGNDEKFREIQEAYEQIKSGVWIRKQQESSAGGGGGDGGGGNANRYSGFRYTTRTHNKSKVSYDEFYEEMHTGKVKKDPFADDEDEAEGAAAKDPRRNPFAMNEIAFQAWLRFIIMWCLLFSSLRVVLFLIFPPKWEKPQRKPPPRELRGQRRPAPKPIHSSEDAIVA